ncbi:MAG TPA: PHB depolymerase family esterase [Flavobacteriales bacterium]|nr:PHB depolymerase family esterase [Flavobacteriales bacterium]
MATVALSAQTKTMLKYVVREPSVKNGEPPLLLLLHGVGSNEHDLFSFADRLPGEFLMVSARAPHALGQDSYGWYSVDFSSGKPVYDAQQAEESRKLIISFLDELHAAHPFDRKRVFLCGFSQGAIMSYSVALTRPDLVAGIAVMSGRLLDDVKPMIKAPPELSSLKVLISHGTQDPVLPISGAEQANAYLRSLGISAALKTYPAGHTISAAALEDLVAWLSAALR